jgi:hypothetical protein
VAFITETVVSMSDLINKLDAFLVGEGWTQDQLDTGAGKWAIHKTGIGDDVYVQARWDTSTPSNLGLYQSTGFSGTGTDPGNHTGDSGNGAISGTNATLGTARHVPIGSSPAPRQYWAFADTDYAHVVVERGTSGVREFVHFGFGNVDKVGAWTGGAYCYGFRQELTGGQVALQQGTTILLDGLSQNGGLAPSNFQNYVATLRLSGFPNQPASQWGVVLGSETTLGTDRGGSARARLVGGARGGPVARGFGRFQTRNTKGLMPGYPILTWYYNTTNGEVQPLGWMKDVRGVNMEFLSPGDELTVGGETWVVFPTWRKYEGVITNTSGYQAWAYRKFS